MSDPSGKYPLGVLTRSAPDWFDDNLGVGGARLAFPQPAGSNYFAVSLVNNDNQGRVLKVYGIYTSSEGGEGVGFWFSQVPLGTQQAGPFALRPDRAKPTGQIFYTQSLANPNNTPNPFQPAVIISAIGSSGFDSDTVFSPFPIFIVPQGFALIASNLQTTFNGGCFFWYQVCNE
jgi:hypothetical protein